MIITMSTQGTQMIGGRVDVPVLMAVRVLDANACGLAQGAIIRTHCDLPFIWPTAGRKHPVGYGAAVGFNI